MASSRLTYLYPKCLRHAVTTELAPVHTSVRNRPARGGCQRYYSAATAIPETRHQAKSSSSTRTVSGVARSKASEHNGKAPVARTGREIGAAQSQKEKGQISGTTAEKSAEAPKSRQTVDTEVREMTVPTEKQSLQGRAKPSSGTTAESTPKSTISRPMQAMLQTTMPVDHDASEKPPHLTAPPYVHHFDTWSLVRDLDNGGFGNDASVTLMKAVRGLLAENMELATRGLVSKSAAENELYLFRAACSELKTEVQNNRIIETEKLSGQRTQLQHEVDILNIKYSQETVHLKDTLRGMFDDRKMGIKSGQRNFENKIQELSYKIQVGLNSDARTEVESIRWFLTQRAAAALAVAVIMILSALNYSRHAAQVHDKERHKQDELAHAEAARLASDSVQNTIHQGGDDEALLAGEGITTG